MKAIAASSSTNRMVARLDRDSLPGSPKAELLATGAPCVLVGSDRRAAGVTPAEHEPGLSGCSRSREACPQTSAGTDSAAVHHHPTSFDLLHGVASHGARKRSHVGAAGRLRFHWDSGEFWQSWLRTGAPGVNC